MALFERKQNAVKPDAASEKDAASGKQESVSKMDGYTSLSDVKNAAPESTASFTIEPEKQRRGRSTPQSRRTAEDEGKIQQEKDRIKALEIAGKHFIGKIAALPYDAWAKLAADDYHHLKEEEVKELADSYYLLAQGFKLDLSNPWIVLLMVGASHVVFVSDRLSHMRKKAEEQEQADINSGKIKVN